MKRKAFGLFLGLACVSLLILLGCARLAVEAPKEPIKVDISMRLDIYQHIEKDINAIEDIVSGQKEVPAPVKDNQSLLDSLIACAYAQEGLSPEVERAAMYRKDTRPELSSWEAKGVVGENRLGLVQLIKSQEAGPQVQELIKQENANRMVIYEAVAKKNNSTIEEVQKLYAVRLQKDAPAGTPVEVFNEATGTSEWKVK